MATLTAGNTSAVRMDQIDVTDIYDGDNLSHSSTKLVVDVGDGDIVTFVGTGFKFDSDDAPTAGTVSGFDISHNSNLVFQVTGASVSAQALGQAVANGDTATALDYFFHSDDTFTGSTFDDVLDAGQGNNIISGGGGSDTLFAGNGNNHIYGNALGSAQGAADGDDAILVGNGTNYVNGNAGNDTIIGGDGVNRFYGGAGDDIIQVGNGNNAVNGNVGNDSIIVGNGSNVLRGGQGDDNIYTNNATVANGNVEYGDLGHDTFHTGIGCDVMTGGADGDTFVLGGTSNGSAAAMIGGGTYYDEVTDFNAAEDHFIIRTYLPDQVVSSGAGYASEADAQAAAQSQLAALGDAHAVVANQVGQDTFLFFNSTGGSTNIDSFLKLDGIAASSVTTASFLAAPSS